MHVNYPETPAQVKPKEVAKIVLPVGDNVGGRSRSRVQQQNDDPVVPPQMGRPKLSPAAYPVAPRHHYTTDTVSNGYMVRHFF